MILVVGGTGRLGKEAVRLLVARGAAVRVLSRNAAAAKSPGSDGVEVVTGDVRDQKDVARAMAGVTTVVSAAHGFMDDPRGIDLGGNVNLIEAAEAAGASHFVLLSVYGAAEGHPIELFHMKHLAEQRLVASKLAWTILRPTAFMELWVSLLAAPLLAKKKTVIFGPGTNPINFVSVPDVARFVELAVTDPATRGRVLEIAGPEDLSFGELVATYERVTGASGTKSHVPLPMMRVMAPLMRVLVPSLGRQIRAGVVMNTRDMTFRGERAPEVPMTTLADAIRRTIATEARSSPA